MKKRTPSPNPPDELHEWFINDKGNNYFVNEDGHNEYENGMIHTGGRAGIIRPPQTTMITTSERGLELRNRQKELAQEAVQKAIMEGTRSPDVFSGIEMIAKAQVNLSQDTEKGHASTRAAEWILKQTGLFDKDKLTVKDGKGGSASGSPQDVIAVFSELMKAREQLTADSPPDLDEES